MPWSQQNRTQLIVSLEGLSNDKRAKVDRSAADRAYQIALSASPHHQIVLVARAQYLINSGHWRDDEMAPLVKQLERFKRQHETWLVSALYHGLNGEQDKAIEALRNGLEAGGTLAEAQKVANSINLEITEQ